MGTDDRLKKLVAKTEKKAPKTEAPKKPKKTAEPTLDFSQVNEMSESELVEIAHLMGLQASRQLPREDLIDIILCARDTPHIDPVESMREKIHRYVSGNRIMVASMPCDLDCPSCPKRAVTACYTVNHDLLGVLNE